MRAFALPSRWTRGSVLILAALVGCSDEYGTSEPTFAVTGKVVLADGKPLTAGRVTFVAKDGLKPPASGEVAADGRFTLTTRAPNDGAIPGDYKVRVEPAAAGAGVGKARPRGLRFPVKYVDEDSSGLTVTVKAAENTLEPIKLR